MIKTLSLLIALLLAPTAAWTADFTFNVLIRAGASGAGDWEVGMGTGASNSAVTGQVNYFNDLSPQRFEIGYNANTQQAYTRIYGSTAAGSPLRLNLTYSIPSTLSTLALWNLPASSFYVNAAPTPGLTAITADNMSLGVLNPVSMTSLNLFGVIGTGPVNQPANLSFTGRSWMLSGNLSLLGLSAYGGTANGSELAFGLSAHVTDTPEPGTLALLVPGLLALAWRHRRRQSPV